MAWQSSTTHSFTTRGGGPGLPSDAPDALSEVRDTMRDTREFLERAGARRHNNGELLYRCSSSVILGWNNILIFLNTGLPSMEEIARTEAVGLEFAARHAQDGYFLLSVAKAGAPVPDGKTRERSAAMLQRLRNGLHATVFVYEGEGFRAATLRGAVTGVMSAANFFSKNKMQMFSTVADASAWLEKQNSAGKWHAEDLYESIAAHQEAAR
jgi:hypothetical protein